MIDSTVSPQAVSGRAIRRVFVLATVAAFALLGLYLRYVYARGSSPYIDEYTTMWVAQMTAQRGYPVFPTGALYAQGLLFTYLDALLFRLFGFSELMARLPGLVFSVASIPLVYWVGSRILSAREGLLACALLALDPQSIGWGGRSRSYSLLVFLVVAAVYFLHRGVVREDRASYRRLALLLLVAAVFSHNEAILLYPAFVAAGLLWRGWRTLLRWPVLVDNVLALGGMAVSFYLYRLMQPAGWSEVGEGQGEVALSLDVATAWSRLKPFFFGPDQLPFVGVLTALLVIGLVYLAVRAWREGPRTLLSPGGQDGGMLFLSVLLVVVMVEMLFFVTEERLGARYLFMLGPVFFLIAAAALARIMTFVGRVLRDGTRLVGPATAHPLLASCAPIAALLMLATVFALPASVAAAHRQELKYDSTFTYVREHMREGDKVMTFATSPCVLYLGRCDYVAVEKEFHAYATQRGEYWVEAWAGAPILFTDDTLEKAIEEADRMWFVIDQMRFRTRYTQHFIQYVWDNMHLVAREGGVFVFLAEPSPYPPPEVEGTVLVRLGDEAELIGYMLNTDVLAPGDEIRLSLRWRGLTHIKSSYSVFVHLVGADGALWAQSDGAPIDGLLPTTYWVAGERMTDPREMEIASDIPPGTYRLDVGMYDPETMDHLTVRDEMGTVLGDRVILDFVRVREGPPGLPVPEHDAAANLGNVVTLLGYDLDPPVAEPAQPVRIGLYWRAEAAIEGDYTVFVHLIDDTDKIWGQSDSQPEGGFYPTSYWDAGEVIRDEHKVVIDPAIPPGAYRLEVGMYLLDTGERLSFMDQEGHVTGDAMILGAVQVRE